MSVNSMEFKEMIYGLMNGDYNLEEFPVKESEIVEDEFAEGKYCDILYRRMHEAYGRLCARLGNTDGEDLDVEIIIASLMDIGRYQGLKMYDYGEFFAKKEQNQ